MNENNNNTINRRRFFGLMGSGAAVTAASLAGCSSEKQRAVTTLPAEVPTDICPIPTPRCRFWATA